MRFNAYAFTAALPVALLGCAVPQQANFPDPTDHVPLDQIRIESRFPMVNLTRDNLGAELGQCVPQLHGNSRTVQQHLIRFPSADIAVFGHHSSSKKFVVHRARGFCLHASSAKFPIYAAEAFFETVNPVGVPPDVVDGWYKQLATLIANKGSAKVAYRFANGNAFVANYWTEPRTTYVLNYSSEFKRVGTWETESLDLNLTHASLSSVSETKIGGAARKPFLLSHQAR